MECQQGQKFFYFIHQLHYNYISIMVKLETHNDTTTMNHFQCDNRDDSILCSKINWHDMDYINSACPPDYNIYINRYFSIKNNKITVNHSNHQHRQNQYNTNTGAVLNNNDEEISVKVIFTNKRYILSINISKQVHIHNYCYTYYTNKFNCLFQTDNNKN